MFFLPQLHQQAATRGHLSYFDPHRLDSTRSRRPYRQLHLHGLHDDQEVSFLYEVADFHGNLNHRPIDGSHRLARCGT